MSESQTIKGASDRLLLVVDLAGTFLFGLEGADGDRRESRFFGA
jgi:hypothetical protein